MNEHPQFDEDFDLYALGAFDAEERSGIESHISHCEACAEKLAAARQRLALVALSVPEIRPPAQIKQRLMDRIRQESPAATRLQERQRSWMPALWLRPGFAWACTACVMVSTALLAVYDYRLQHKLQADHAEMLSLQRSAAHDSAVSSLLTSADTQQVLLTQVKDSSRPEGRIYYHPSRGLLFYAANLPAAPSGQVYQLWLVPTEGLPVSAGVFQPNPKGEASVILPVLPTGLAAKAFAVTLEPAGGVPQPTGPKVLIGSPS